MQTDADRRSSHAFAAKQYIEEHYKKLHQKRTDRHARRQQLMNDLHQSDLTEDQRDDVINELNQTETSHMRMSRKSMSIADFELLKIIGKGAFGEVHLARITDTDQICALKVLRKADMLKRSQVAHVRAERDVLAISSDAKPCPFIIELFCTFQDSKHLYLATEFGAGGDLMSLLIARDILDIRTARHTIAEVILAVDAVHKMGYLHRDLKPDNILFTAEGHIKLTDFGLASPGVVVDPFTGMYERGPQASPRAGPVDDTLSQRQHIKSWRSRRRLRAFSAVGTPDYVSPEVLQRLPEGYGMEADWWSVGVILYECLVGYAPFYADTARDTCTKIVRWREYLHFPKDVTLPAPARSLICAFLRDAPHRLGRGGLTEIQSHPFFAGFDWGGLLSRTPPFVPDLSGETDTKYFDVFRDEIEAKGPTVARDIKGVDLAAPDRWRKREQDVPFIGYSFKRSEADEVVRQLSPRGKPAPARTGLASVFGTEK